MVRAHRRLAVSVALGGLPFLLMACGGSDAATGETTAGPSTTPWHTIPPVVSSDTGSTVPSSGNISYIIQKGDYPAKIAARLKGDCTGQDLLDYNPELQTKFPLGATMKIPVSCLGPGVTEDSLGSGNADTTDTTGDTTGDSTDTTDAPKYNEYIVVKGDYEFGIVKKTGCSSSELRKANPGKMSRLRAKMKLKIPVSCDTREDNTDDTST
jgi:LysM repeat protein